MELSWTKQMSVGNESLDSEHKKLLDMVNDVERAIRSRDGVDLSKAFKLFEKSIRAHFETEATIAQAINHPFEQHQSEHQYVLNELQIINEELVAKNGKWSESAAEYYYHFLSRWATEHISEDDMKMKAVLESYPYNYKP